jgi:hypothetical protein
MTDYTQRHCAGSTQFGRKGSSPGSSSAGLHSARLSEGQLTLQPWHACVLAMVQALPPGDPEGDADPDGAGGVDWQASTESDNANATTSCRM